MALAGHFILYLIALLVIAAVILIPLFVLTSYVRDERKEAADLQAGEIGVVLGKNEKREGGRRRYRLRIVFFVAGLVSAALTYLLLT